MLAIFLLLLVMLNLVVPEFGIASDANVVLAEIGKHRPCKVHDSSIPAGGVNAKKYLHWSNPPSSGLGDRMINVLAAQTIAWYECKTLFLIWPPSSKGLSGTFPTYSSLFETTPGLVVIDKKKGNGKKIGFEVPKSLKPEVLDLAPGWGYPMAVIYNIKRRLSSELMNNEHIILEDVVRVYNALGRHLKPRPKISRLIASNFVPRVKGAIGLHIRRGDKTTVDSQAMQGISSAMLATLHRTTPQVLDEVLKIFPGATVFIASDSTAEKQRYSTFISERGGSAIVFRKHGHSRNKKWIPYNIGIEDALADIWLLAQCSVVLQSTSMSSFSAFGAAIGNGKLINLLPASSKCQMRRCHRFSDIVVGLITPWENRTDLLMDLKNVRYN